MKFVGYVTIRLNSTRVPQKSIRLLGGKPLVNYPIEILNWTPVKDIILYSHDDLSDYIDSDLNYTWVKRPKKFDKNATTFNDILDSIVDDIDADFIVFLTCTSPFIKPTTVTDMIQQIKSKGYDSAFTAYKHQMFSWYRDLPINYDLSNVPRTQDIHPVFVETSGLYIFSKELYQMYGRRIGVNRYIQEVDILEGWDIDTMRDWEIAEWIAKVEKDKKG